MHNSYPRPRQSWRALWVLVGAFSVQGCIPLGSRHLIASNVVQGKSGENTFISQDGATCRVSADDYERVKIGDSHRCLWEYARGEDAGSLIPDPKRGISPPRSPRPKIPPAD